MRPLTDVPIIIPARGGSKRIHRKNLRTVGGRTLLRRAIDNGYALSETVIVSSEDDEILDAAAFHGAAPHRRPPALADDVVHAVAAVHEVARARGFGWVVMLNCSVPFIDPEAIRDFLLAHNWRRGPFPAFTAYTWHGFLYGTDGKRVFGGPSRPRSQEQKVYKEDGGFYLLDTLGETADQIQLGARMIPVEPSIEIDTEYDLRFAQAWAGL